MPNANPGEVWMADLGMQAKVRPVLILTPPPRDDEQAVVIVMSHTTSLHGYRWELSIPKSFLAEGAFNVGSLNTIPTVKLVRKLGALTPQEFALVREKLAERLGL